MSSNKCIGKYDFLYLESNNNPHGEIISNSVDAVNWCLDEFEYMEDISLDGRQIIL